jgi:uncharacterized membrane protein YfhO
MHSWEPTECLGIQILTIKLLLVISIHGFRVFWDTLYITSDLNTKIKILEEEKASLVTSVRLVNEDKRQLIMEAKRLGNVYEPEPSSEVSNQTTHCVSTQSENPMQNEQHNKIIELVELDKTFQEPNGPNTRNENMNHVVGAAVSGHPNRTSTVKQPNSVCASQIPKSVVPCPFLLRRGHCTKGVNCDFSHSNLESNHYQKYGTRWRRTCAL